MSAVEEIRQAIDTLERLKAESTPGPWKDPEDEMDAEHATDRGWWILNADERGMDQHAVALVLPYNPYREADANLIVALHRTVDAQLALLRGTLARVTSRCAPGDHTAVNDHERDLIQLANAIIGATS